ncbi:hypothetical protein TMS3_0120180 [Pseudomonas taeanensis MS-3]|uniref:Uncharacterized protein n=1 Tax=Pseudomonas taeanensis MS-3 TaxID=1395571 RepID=A0A0A1YEE4_9PSED|nr:hypothetical protein [Pseudomonas taeanensis]KFX68200.1 hypothetical protein TMS3_0120180 [Pseudomonas taeanensis MS-3]
MSPLEHQIQSLRSEQQLRQSSEQSHEAIKDCKFIHARFQDIANSLKAKKHVTEVLKALPQDAPEAMQLSAETQQQCNKAITTLNVFAAVWQQKKSAALQDDALDNAHAVLEDLDSQLEKKVWSCWKAWTTQLDNSCRVEQVLLDTQRGIPGVDQFYTEYVALRAKLMAGTKILPENVWVIQDLAKLAENMRQVHEQMVFDLPVDVSNFFKYLNQSGNRAQAPLSMLTLETLQWLMENEQLGQYTVNRKLY